MTGCILSIIIVFLEIADNRYLLLKHCQKKDVTNATKYARATHRRMNIFNEHVPIGLPYGSMPNVPISLTLPNLHFPHNQYLPIVGR